MIVYSILIDENICDAKQIAPNSIVKLCLNCNMFCHILEPLD